MIQLIGYNSGNWHMVIHGVDCLFTPIKLYKGNNLYPIEPDTANGLRWRVNRKWVSYKQIKTAIAAQ